MTGPTTRAAVLFVQTQPSQLDAPFYSLLARLLDKRLLVALLNDSFDERRDIDPELGFIPQFPTPERDYPIACLPRGAHGIRLLIELIHRTRPGIVVVQDQTWREKSRISSACRRAGIPVAMRSDKNPISRGARTGAGLALERFIVRRLFDAIAPVSRLTRDYYGWHDGESIWWFPYPSSSRKFQRTAAAGGLRASVRERLGIPDTRTVFLSVLKFVDRENPMAVLRAFAHAKASSRDISLILVGAGPLEASMRQFIASRGISDVHLVGYVPFAQLHEYFFAADVFVHLARNEPWGVSAQDALVANMALVVSSGVGAGLCHLSGDLARYVVPVDDDRAAGESMLELVGSPSKRAHFAPAWTAVCSMCTDESLARWWATRIASKMDEEAVAG